jgi:hypothetical protein
VAPPRKLGQCGLRKQVSDGLVLARAPAWMVRVRRNVQPASDGALAPEVQNEEPGQ